MPNYSILIVDDHALFRESVARLLNREPDFDVVSEGGSIEDAIEVMERRHVDLVLLDFDLGQRDGLDFLRQLRRDRPDPGPTILIVTAGVEPNEARDLIREGVSGIFMKRESADRLVQAIRDARAGKV